MAEEQENIMSYEEKKKMILLLGSISHGGILDTIKSAGLFYQRKDLHSSIKNWNSTINLFAKPPLENLYISMVLGKITQTTYHFISDEDYKEVCQKLFSKVASIPNVIYIYEDLLSGKIFEKENNNYNYYDYYHYVDLIPEMLDQANEIILSSGMNVLPYKTAAEVTISGQNFIEEIENGLIFRIYVPSGKLWEGEIERLLSLFRDYMAKVGKLSIRMDQVRTNQGIIYAFCGKEIAKSSDLSQQFEEFSNLLDLCVADPKAAENILRSKDLDYREISQIISRYAKEARRLQIDMKHERESKILAIRHKLESELVDILPNTEDE